MVRFLVLYTYLIITFESCPFFWDLLNFINFQTNYNFYIIFIVLFSLNYIIFNRKEIFNNNLDLLLKLLKYVYIIPTKFFTYLLVEFKKLILHLWYIKFLSFKNTIKIFLENYFFNFFLIWRPLFKKWSYFGYYRSNRSKWIK